MVPFLKTHFLFPFHFSLVFLCLLVFLSPSFYFALFFILPSFFYSLLRGGSCYKLLDKIWLFVYIIKFFVLLFYPFFFYCVRSLKGCLLRSLRQFMCLSNKKILCVFSDKLQMGDLVPNLQLSSLFRFHFPGWRFIGLVKEGILKVGWSLHKLRNSSQSARCVCVCVCLFFVFLFSLYISAFSLTHLWTIVSRVSEQ